MNQDTWNEISMRGMNNGNHDQSTRNYNPNGYQPDNDATDVIPLTKAEPTTLKPNATNQKSLLSCFLYTEKVPRRLRYFRLILTSWMIMIFIRIYRQQSSFRQNLVAEMPTTITSAGAATESIDAVIKFHQDNETNVIRRDDDSIENSVNPNQTDTTLMDDNVRLEKHNPIEKGDDKETEAKNNVNSHSTKDNENNDALITNSSQSVNNVDNSNIIIERESNNTESNDKNEEDDKTDTNRISSMENNNNPNRTDTKTVDKNEKHDGVENDDGKEHDMSAKLTTTENHENNDKLRLVAKDDEEEKEDVSEKSNHPPSIAFMFMVGKDQTVHEDIWERWFRSSTDYHEYNDDKERPKKFSIFVHHGQRHPKYPTESKRTDINESSYRIKILDDSEKSMMVPSPMNPFFCQYVIPSVSTSYYCCLYRAMMQILQIAYDRDPYAEQFVFVSTTSVPLISFDELYDQLIIRHQQRHSDDKDQPSRFCFMAQAVRVWNYMAMVLQLDTRYVGKAEMWTILSRNHVDALLQNRHVMDHWYQTFQNERPGTYPQRIYIGAPDEMFFATMINMVHQQAKQQPQQQKVTNNNNNLLPVVPTTMNNGTMNNFYEEDCLSMYPKNERHNSCCMTKVFWKNRPAVIDITKDMNLPNTNRSILLSDSCHPVNPCLLRGLLYEDGLVQLQSMGYYFLRKVPQKDDHGNPIVVKTLTNETISLHEAMYYLHQRQPMTSSTTAVEHIVTSPTVTSGRMLLQSHNDSTTKLSLQQQVRDNLHVTLSPPLSDSYQKTRHLAQNNNDEQKNKHQFQCLVPPVMDIEHCWCNGLMHT